MACTAVVVACNVVGMMSSKIASHQQARSCSYRSDIHSNCGFCTKFTNLSSLVHHVTSKLMIDVYRLFVMWTKSAPSPPNTPKRPLPEWLASLILFGNNIRKSFGTGLIGDWRPWDETEKEQVKRLEREAKREAKHMHLFDTEEIEVKGQV